MLLAMVIHVGMKRKMVVDGSIAGLSHCGGLSDFWKTKKKLAGKSAEKVTVKKVGADNIISQREAG